MKQRINTALALAILAGVSLVTPASAAVNIDYVSVGNPGNYGSPYGVVRYAYQIGKYEVTNAQYAAFLNAKGASNSYGIYNSNMSSYGIAQTGSSGSYTYSVTSGIRQRITTAAPRLTRDFPMGRTRLPRRMRIMVTAWGTAQTLAAMAVILRKPDIFARVLFRATDSEEVGAALRETGQRDDIRAVFLDIDSPGGTVAGTPDLAVSVLFMPLARLAQDQHCLFRRNGVRTSWSSVGAWRSNAAGSVGGAADAMETIQRDMTAQPIGFIGQWRPS